MINPYLICVYSSLNLGSFGNLTPLLILPSALAFTYLYISSMWGATLEFSPKAGITFPFWAPSATPLPLIITSKNAIYNNSNYNTKFYDNVKVIYLNNVLLSQKLDVNFNENIIKIYENVVYEGLQGTIKADNVELNLMTKNMEIFMQNNNEKVKISSNN